METPKIPKPYRQGDLDSLCGVYAVINAVKHLCRPLPGAEADTLFENMIEFLDSRKPKSRCVIDGIVLNDVGGLLAHVVTPDYPIQRSKGFHGFTQITREFFWNRIQDFMDDTQGVVLTAIGGYHDHWTLICQATDHRLTLYDSSGIHLLNRSHCTLDPENPDRKRHILYPSHTYFLWVDKP